MQSFCPRERRWGEEGLPRPQGGRHLRVNAHVTGRDGDNTRPHRIWGRDTPTSFPDREKPWLGEKYFIVHKLRYRAMLPLFYNP